MKKAIPIFLMFLLMITVVSADEYTEGFTVISDIDSFPYYAEVFGTKVACSNDGSQCAFLFYEELSYSSYPFLTTIDTCPNGKGVKLAYSTNGFEPDIWGSRLSDCVMVEQFTGNVENYNMDTSYPSTDHLPIGISYDEVNENFIVAGMFLGFKTWSPSEGFTVVQAPFSEQHCERYLGTLDDFNSTGVPVGLLIDYRATNLYLSYQYVNGTEVLTDVLVPQTGTSCVSGPPTPNRYGMREIAGYITQDDSNNWEYYLWTNYSDGFANQETTFATTFNLPSSSSGMFYYLPSTLYWSRYNTVNVTNGTWFGVSSDLDSYSDFGLYYAWNNSEDEIIRREESKRGDQVRIYGYERHDSTAIKDIKLFIEEETFIELVLLSENPKTGAESSVDSTSTLKCSGVIIETETGSDIELVSPCETNITIDILTSPPNRPLSFTDTFDLYSGCEERTYMQLKYVSDYIYDYQVLDQLSREPVVNANVTFGSTTYVTDSNGFVYPEVTPLASYGFEQVDDPVLEALCTRGYETTGTLNTYTIQIEADGYTPETLLFQTVATIDSSGNIDYQPGDQVLLKQEGADVRIRVRDGVLQERYIDTGVITVTGNQNGTLLIQEVLGGLFIYRPTNSTNEYPYRFLLIDDRPLYNATFNLSYAGKTYLKNVTINENQSIYNDWIDIDDFNCGNNLDCRLREDSLSVCEGNFFTVVGGCVEEECVYSSDQCIFGCDDDVGCYDFDTSQDCTTNGDCLNASLCLNDWTSRTGYCGADGSCKLIDNACNVPTTFPDGIERGCDINGTFGTEGICVDSGGCLEEGFGKKYRFLIQKQYIPNSWFAVVTTTNYLDLDFYCSASNTNSRTCIRGKNVAESEVGSLTVDNKLITLAGTSDSRWSYLLDDQTYYFYDVSANCDGTCDLDVEFCEFGCNTETGFCQAAPQSSEETVRNTFQNLGSMFSGWFPDPTSRAIIWIGIMLIAMTLTTVMTRSGDSAGRFEIGALSGLGVALLGIIVGWMPLILGVIFIILTATATAAWLTKGGK